MVVAMFVCLSVLFCSVIFSMAAVMKVAMQIKLGILNWLDVHFKA